MSEQLAPLALAGDALMLQTFRRDKHTCTARRSAWTVAVLLGAVVLHASVSRSAEPLRLIEPDSASASSRAVIASGGLAFTSQILPLDARGQLAGKNNAAKQVAVVLDNLERVLTRSGARLDALVKVNFCVTGAAVAVEVRKALPKRFPEKARPALAFVTSALPHPEALVAADAVFVPGTQPKAVQSDSHPDLKGHPGNAHVATLPRGARVYVSGQAEKGDLGTATRQTLDSLRATLKQLRLTDAHIVQVKAFVMPLSEVGVVEKAIAAFYGQDRTPPLVFVEWQASKASPIEIELVAWAGPDYPAAPDVIDYLAAPGLPQSPIFSRVAKVHYGPAIYVSGLHARKETDARAEVEDVFAQLEDILKKAGSDLKHLAKATYYVSSEGASKALNELRPRYYDRLRPPAASKAMTTGVALNGRALTLDMIAVPTLKVLDSLPEVGHGLTPQEAAQGWISLFDGQGTFGWKNGLTEKGLLLRGSTTFSFGRCAVKADVIAGGKLTLGGKDIEVKPGAFALADSGGSGAIVLGEGVRLRALAIRPLGAKPLFDGKSLAGWKRIDRETIPEQRRPKWRVDEGAIVATGGPGALEYVPEKFGDFVLQIDIRTRVRHANSGVFFRAIPGDFMNGYEAQVYNRCLDGDPAKPVLWATGAIKGQNARRVLARDFVSYRMTVIAQGSHLATWINGYQATDWTDLRPPHFNPRNGLRTQAGAIQLQAHDSLCDVEFKNIRIAN